MFQDDHLESFQFHKQVTNITPQNGKWKLTLIDLKTKESEVIEDYDSVLICNGHYHKPSMPKIEGMDTFSGIQMHSNIYRSPERFSRLKVLVIGAGPSGQDIASKISAIADKVS